MRTLRCNLHKLEPNSREVQGLRGIASFNCGIHRRIATHTTDAEEKKGNEEEGRETPVHGPAWALTTIDIIGFCQTDSKR